MNYLLALLASAASGCIVVGVFGDSDADDHHQFQYRLPPQKPPPQKSPHQKIPPPTSAATSIEMESWAEPEPITSMYNPAANWTRCEHCPPNSLLALFIFSTVMTASNFDKVKDTWKSVYESCAKSPGDTRVGYMTPTGKSSSVEWAYNSSSFQAMRDRLKVNSFQLNNVPSSDDFEAMIEEALKATQAGLGPEPDPYNPAAKEVLIITDLNLSLTPDDANDIVQKMKSDRFYISYLWLGMNGKSALPNNKYSNNLNPIVDPGKWPVYIGDWSELDATQIQQLAACIPNPGTSYMESKNGSSSTQWIMIVSIVVGVVVIVAILASLCVVYKRVTYNYKAKMERYRAEARNHATIPNHYQDLERRDEWTIPKERLEVMFDQKLGAGAFSNVFKGKLSGTAPVCTIYPSIQTSRSYTDCDVAVKILPTFADDMAKSDFVQEINFMKSLGYHPHLICMLGMVWEKLDEPRLVIEYCIRGDLLGYIREKKSEIINGYANTAGLKLKDLLSYSWQISDGMDYLASKGCIHRDLAARNILLDNTNTAKIGDFGLCRLTDRSLYTTRGGRLPIKWMAIESLKSYEYSTKSDVWSFGVLLFELFSLGDVPFPRVQPADMIDHLDTGARLHQPSFCPNEIYAIMRRSWLVDPRSRPSFEIVRNEIAKLLEGTTENYGYLPVENGQYVSEVDAQNAANIARELQNSRNQPTSVNSISRVGSGEFSGHVNDAVI